MMKRNLCIGIDYGTDSVRALLVRADDGEELASSVFVYPRWKNGLYCDPVQNRFRQHPLDYLEGLENTVKNILARVPGSAEKVAAISIDTTGSTPAPVDGKGMPLALLPGFEEDPDAMFILWKDHSSIHAADMINAKCREWETDYSRYSGGTYSSEWFWSKMIHVLEGNEKVAKAAVSWVEHCDWMPALLTGNTDPAKMKRSRCAAGHKAMWHEAWGGLPPAAFWLALSSKTSRIIDHLFSETFTSDIAAGNLCQEWAERLGLDESVLVGVGALDAHIGAVGGEIMPYYLSKVIGTSTCDMLTALPEEVGERLMRGISGQVDGSIIPGMIGMEAGQSAFGDIYAWFRDLLMWPLVKDDRGENETAGRIRAGLIAELSRAAEKIPPGETDLVALDWHNGRRTPDANPHLKGAIAGLTLGSGAPAIFRALVEATAFGSKLIADRFRDQGIPIKGILALGGVAKKSPFVMQVLSDVVNMPIRVVRSEHTCALGAAMFAAVIAGLHPDISQAQEKMGKGFEKEYQPVPANVRIYSNLFQRYQALGSFVEQTTH